MFKLLTKRKKSKTKSYRIPIPILNHDDDDDTTTTDENTNDFVAAPVTDASSCLRLSVAPAPSITVDESKSIPDADPRLNDNDGPPL